MSLIFKIQSSININEKKCLPHKSSWRRNNSVIINIITIILSYENDKLNETRLNVSISVDLKLYPPGETDWKMSQKSKRVRRKEIMETYMK